MQTQDVIKLLDDVLTGLDQVAKQAAAQTPAQPATPVPASVMSVAADVPQTPAPLADAIDREINAPQRQTAIVSLRDSAAAQQFRQELETESLTVTTATALLQLLKQAVQVFGALAA